MLYLVSFRCLFVISFGNFSELVCEIKSSIFVVVSVFM
jgi:hypothetical protein